jgi:hypothetical protein
VLSPFVRPAADGAAQPCRCQGVLQLEGIPWRRGIGDGDTLERRSTAEGGEHDRRVVETAVQVDVTTIAAGEDPGQARPGSEPKQRHDAAVDLQQ